MSIRHEAFSIGIEEEYLLIDPETRALAGRQPAGFMARCKEILGSRVTHEFLQSQVEIGTASAARWARRARNCSTCARPLPPRPRSSACG